MKSLHCIKFNWNDDNKFYNINFIEFFFHSFMWAHVFTVKYAYCHWIISKIKITYLQPLNVWCTFATIKLDGMLFVSYRMIKRRRFTHLCLRLAPKPLWQAGRQAVRQTDRIHWKKETDKEKFDGTIEPDAKTKAQNFATFL